MRVRLLFVGVIIIFLTGCHNDYDEIKLSLDQLKQEKIILTEKIDEMANQNDKLKEKLNTSKSHLTTIEKDYSEKILTLNNKNEQLKKKLYSLEEELTDTKSWSQLRQNDTEDWQLDEYQTTEFIKDVMIKGSVPVHNIIICDTYITQVETITSKNLMVLKLYESLVYWEEVYNNQINEYIDDTVEGDYKQRLYAQWSTKSMIEKELNEIQALTDGELKSILMQAKKAGYIASKSEEVVVLEHDRSFLIEKYKDYISDDFLTYLELEDQMKQYGSWYSEEASKSQLKLINLIKENYLDSNFKLLSNDELIKYEQELKDQLKNKSDWDSYGLKEISIVLHA